MIDKNVVSIKMNKSMSIEDIIEFFRTASDNERAKLTEMMSNMNVSNRNIDKTEIFAKKINEKKNEKKTGYVRFLESKSVNGLIWGPTQVGKSAATRIFIETCFRYNTPVIVSTDNKTDQQEQLFNRIESELMGASVELLKVSDKTFENNLKMCIETGNKRFVVFCLDNASQIEKVITNLTSNYIRYNHMKDIKRIAIIHDEADTVAKDQDIENIIDSQAVSHRKWLELRDIINKRMGEIELKRIFVTATPENVVMLYKVECPDVMRLEIPGTYTGYDKIKNIEMEDDLNTNENLVNEVGRIKESGTYEAILYCIDRKITDGHEILLGNLSRQLDCIVNTYNGKGITAYIKKDMEIKFEKKLHKNEIKFCKKGVYYTMRRMTIRKFYSIVKSLGENCVVTIGKDLISRGISYVGENTDEPITATTMFYRPGKTMNAVGICQTIGRITGCAMPTLERRLYCPKDVYDTYISYNKNQEKFIKTIEDADENTMTRVLIESTIFEKYKRSIDRPKLKLSMRMIESENDNESESIDGDRMDELIDLWWCKETIIGKILSFVYKNKNGVIEKELNDFIKECDSQNVSSMYKELIRIDKNYNYVFERKNNITKITKKAREYIDGIKN